MEKILQDQSSRDKPINLNAHLSPTIMKAPLISTSTTGLAADDFDHTICAIPF